MRFRDLPAALHKRCPGLSGLVGDSGRFLVAGTLNTLLGIVLYQILLFRLPEKAAWTICWAIGILLVSVAYPKLVFKHGRLSPRRFFAHVLFYLVSFLISLGLLAAYVDVMGVPPRWAVFLVYLVTVPLNFLCSRFIFTFRAMD